MNRIRVERGETTRMAKLFGCTSQNVRYALRGYIDGERSDKIRAEAIRSGGVEVKKRRVQK